MKSISINGPEAEVIPGCDLVSMLRRLAEEQGKQVEIQEAKLEGRVMKLVGKTLLVVGSIYFAIHLIAYLVKP